jgi:hypothetical protein
LHIYSKANFEHIYSKANFEQFVRLNLIMRGLVLVPVLVLVLLKLFSRCWCFFWCGVFYFPGAGVFFGVVFFQNSKTPNSCPLVKQFRASNALYRTPWNS